MKDFFSSIKMLLPGNGKIKTIILGALLFTVTYCSQGQNLIDNASFEDMLTCPGGTFSGIPNPSQGPLFLTNWYAPNAGTSDYYNVCSNDTLFRVPNNFSGHQTPRTGAGYVGVILSQIGNEYVESELNTPMINGHKYFVSYWTVVADRSPAAADRFGAYFSNSVIDLPNNTLLNQFTPQVVSPAGVPYVDSVNWSKVSKTFVANGGEKWMTIGVFKDWDSLTLAPFVEDGGFGFGQLYYYIDDVCVLDMDGPADDVAIHNAALCPHPSVKLDARAGMEAYTWNDGNTAPSRQITQQGIYWVKSVQLNTCSIVVDTFKVTGNISEVKLNIGNDTILCAGESVRLDVKDENFNEYNWSTGDATTSIIVTTPGSYYVSASGNCFKGADTIEVKAGNNCNVCLFVPNAFSPNNDGLNDVMMVNTICPVGFFQLDIYNRYGEKVFGSANPAIGWNGAYKGKPSDVGTYFYYIQYKSKTDVSNAILELKGELVLVR
jgi:gliding motility-associated-like protein